MSSKCHLMLFSTGYYFKCILYFLKPSVSLSRIMASFKGWRLEVDEIIENPIDSLTAIPLHNHLLNQIVGGCFLYLDGFQYLFPMFSKKWWRCSHVVLYCDIPFWPFASTKSFNHNYADDTQNTKLIRLNIW